MASHKERFADKMEFPPETPQPNIYPLSWNANTKKLQEVWEASLRENWDPEKLPWDTLDVDSYTWEERESIAYWWSLLSVFDASAPPVFAEALIKTYEVHEEDPSSSRCSTTPAKLSLKRVSRTLGATKVATWRFAWR